MYIKYILKSSKNINLISNKYITSKDLDNLYKNIYMRIHVHTHTHTHTYAHTNNQVLRCNCFNIIFVSVLYSTMSE